GARVELPTGTGGYAARVVLEMRDGDRRELSKWQHRGLFSSTADPADVAEKKAVAEEITRFAAGERTSLHVGYHARRALPLSVAAILAAVFGWLARSRGR